MNESRPEVTALLNILVQRPSALPAVCAQVPGLPRVATAPTAHELVGYGAVVTGASTGTTQAPWPTQVQGTNGFAAKQSVMNKDSVDGVRGKPPRGRPV
jgi:hypothetical protein